MLQELGAFLDAFAINFIFVYLLVAVYILVCRRLKQHLPTPGGYESHFQQSYES
uniref:ORF5a protein n=1 Tax=Mikumi yellow baboon virus 1 TaxID=1546177 RepID=A0A089G0K0_9NIDO|nr:ORF5a protein [Mikumi yellow baboon virus 1]